MVLAQGALAALCLLFGVLPTNTVEFLSRITLDLTGYGVSAATREGWMWLTPIAPEVASYSAPLILLGVLAALGAWAAVYIATRHSRRIKPVPRLDPWDCGFGPLTPRMQYSASAFAMPIRHIFRPAWRIHEEKVREMDPMLTTRPSKLSYLIHADDLCWHFFYVALERFVLAAARQVGRIQTGHLRHYLAYSFFTLIALLWLIT
jgi:hypothetical protein